MREPDVRLSDAERSAFAALEELLTAPLPPGRGARARRWVRSNRPVVEGVTTVIIGLFVMIGSLVAAAPIVGVTGVWFVVWGTARATRRVTWAWVVLRWRRRAAASSGEHMWEP